ncbi:FH2 domain-containing protein 1-like isoform X2 [Artemia franciscana]|uniref:FH2 domain-containing protein 1-like isoform X2 n=1 Tax=Artemia franciscana TaxID=6661 RepID=UPI0032DB6F47
MEPRIGLDYIVENKEYTAKLASALDTENVIVKKQVLELLSALCVYNAEGYTRSLEVLEQYKTKHSERYRFSVILKELKNAQTNEYKAALIAFINCLIISTTNLHDRIRIRNEFVGLKLISVLSDIRREKAIDNDVLVQLDVFDEQRDSDESQFSGPEGVDLSSPLDVFHAVFRQVADTPQEMTFLNILQHLLRIDMRENISDMIWDTAETMIHKVTLLDSVEERQKLIRSTSYGNIPNKFVPKYKGGETRCLCGCHRDEMGRRKSSLTNNAASPGLLSPRETSPLPQQRSPGHSPLPAGLQPPPGVPPPPPTGLPPPPPPPGCGSTPAPPSGVPPMPLHKIPPLSSPEIKIKLPQQNIPKPKAKMKTFNWNKLPDSKVVNGRNVWTLAAENHKEAAKDLDWSEMEGLFCQQSALPQNVRFDPNAPPRTPDAERKKKEQEIMLLDGKRSLNINIILKQFRSSNDQILHLIKTGAHDEIGAERLRGLLKILPTNDEVEALKSFDGDHNRLGSAEKFLLQLIAVPSYRLRIDAMLLKEEFSANVTYLEPAINAMIVAGEELKEDQRLRELLYMVVLAGNFLNSGGYAGNAAGVKLASLQKLTDIRANKPGMNLIHYVALQAEKKDKALLEVADNLPALEEATKATTDQLKNDVAALDLKVTRITKQLESQPTGSDIKEQMDEFLKLAETQVNELKEDLKMLDQIRSELAEFFCEEKETFKLEECFKVFFNFLSKLKHAVLDNQKRLQQEAIAQARRKQREELLARRRQSHGFSGSVSGSESDAMDVDDFGNRSLRLKRTVLDLNGTLSDREPSFLNVLESPRLKRRQGSFSGPNQETSEDKMQVDEFSATGSLRRRRSRVPSEEDDSNLLEYLRASGHGDGTRERLSVGSLSETYGSLDRSWARRLRGGKRRPDLLSADLTGESVPKVQKEAEEITEKPPDQKVEAWLLNNVQQRSKASDIRKRFWKHRKSLDIESDKIQEPANAVHLTALSPLPEVTTPRTDPAISGLTSQKPPTSSNWKPNINTKDVSNAMEVIEDAAKKSPLRKQAPKAVDMDKRKAVIASLGKQSDFQDSLTVYVRGKSVEREETVKDLDMSVKSGHESQPKLDISVRSGHAKSSPILIKVTDTSEKPRVPISSSPPKQKIDKIDIDSENIETPPVTRRSFSSVRPLLSLQSTYASDEDDDMMSLRRNKKWSGEENKNKWKDSDLGEGKFDRYSSIRRSRRIRKAPEGAPSSDEEPAFERKEPDGVDSELEKVESNDRVEDKLESTPTSETKKSKRSFRWSLVEKSDVEKAIAQIDDAVDGTKMKDDSWKSRLTRSFRHSTDKDKPSVKQVERAKENVPPTKDMGLRRLSSASIVSKKENTTGLRRTVSSASTNEKPKSLFRSKKEPAESKPLRFGSLVRTLTGVKESQKKDIKPVSPVKPVSTTTRTVFALPKMQSRDSLYEAPKAAAATTTKSKTNARPPTKVTIGQAPQLRSLNRTNRRSDIVPSPTSSLSPTGSLRRSGSSLAPPRTPLLRSESVRVRTATRVDPSKPPVKLSQLKPATPIVPKLPARTSGGFSFMRPTASSSAKDGIHTTKAAPRRK